MERKIIFSVGEYYHLYNRGVDKRRIFLNDRDRKRFVKLLYLANGTESYKFDRVNNKKLKDIDRGEPLVAIGAYVLMPNHFHILVKEISDGGISLFMEKLTTGYSMYFNKKENRSGALFQGTFKAEHAGKDEYLKYLFSYIHLNPVKLVDPMWREHGIHNRGEVEKYLSHYHYSSYLDYKDAEREESLILTKQVFPDYFHTEKDFNENVKDWLEYKNSSNV